jgi:hypothetical protein
MEAGDGIGRWGVSAKDTKEYRKPAVRRFSLPHGLFFVFFASFRGHYLGRTSRHCRTVMLISVSAMFSQLPCLGA